MVNIEAETKEEFQIEVTSLEPQSTNMHLVDSVRVFYCA